MALKLDDSEAKQPPHVMSEQCAEYLSRLWQAVSFLEEARANLSRIRQSTSRDISSSTLRDAIQLIVFAADVMVPEAMRRRPGLIQPHTGLLDSGT